MSTSYFPWCIGQVSSSDGITDVKGMVIAGMRVELRISWNAKAGTEDTKAPTPDSECLQVPNGKVCFAFSAAVQTHIQSLV